MERNFNRVPKRQDNYKKILPNLELGSWLEQEPLPYFAQDSYAFVHFFLEAGLLHFNFSEGISVDAGSLKIFYGRGTGLINVNLRINQIFCRYLD